MSFITIHLVAKVKELIQSRQTSLRHKGFFYFNEPIVIKTKDKRNPIIINRVNSDNPYEKEQILPLSFYYLGGAGLYEIYKRLKENDFFIYKKLEDGKDYKVRLKKIEKDKSK